MTNPISDPIQRCAWAKTANPLYLKYHDEEWGTPSHDDRFLFEMLCLEGAQAGLSWETILNKRQAYRKAFANFDADKIARFSDAKLEKILQDPGVVRNRLKIWSVRGNAKAFLRVRAEFGSFDRYIWQFVSGKPLLNSWTIRSRLPSRTEISDRMSKDMKKRGFNFVGSTICYAYMQAIGMVNDHVQECFLYHSRNYGTCRGK